MPKKRVVHIAPFTPHLCGLYETAREIVSQERKNGYDAFFYDPRPEKADDLADRRVPDWSEDRGVCTVPFDFVKSADIIVSHSGLTEELRKLEIPYIHIAHGRPYSSFMLENTGKTAVYSMYRSINNDPLLKAVVTLWSEYQKHIGMLFDKKPVHTFEAPVNLEHWYPAETSYDFNGQAGDVNVVCSDIWRVDKNPYHVVHGFMEYAKTRQGAKLHMYAVDLKQHGWKCLLGMMKERGILGEVRNYVDNLDHVYRAADVMITPHKIATRTVREAIASGLQVVAGAGNKYTAYTADEEDIESYAGRIQKAHDDLLADGSKCESINRSTAVKHFDAAKTGNQMCDLIQRTINDR